MFNPFKEATTELKDIEGLLKGHVNGRVTKHVVEPLTSFGENYGSEILRVEATVEENGKEKVIHAVAKLIPPTKEQLEVFNTQVTFKNEICFYDVIVPTLEDFQRECKVDGIADYFPKLYGGRLNLKPGSDEVDLDAVIMLENLKIEGYHNADRTIGFDLDTAKTILLALADFQGTAIALKLKKPDIFQSKIRPYLSGLKPQPPPKTKDGEDPLFVIINKIIKENPKTAHLSNRLRRYVAKKHFKRAREPWSTIVHNDLWVNNIMINQKDDKTLIKFVDFQVMEFGSTVSDLLFFLFSSVQTPVLRYHFDKLLLFYYNVLIKTLQQYKIDITDFPYEDFLDEINQEMQYELNHVLFMLMPIFGPKGLPKRIGKVAEWNPHKLSNEVANGGATSSSHLGPGPEDRKGPPPEMMWPKLPPACKEKVWIIFEEADRRRWI